MTCDNANATLPFGAIDTPTQGGAAGGSSYVNFGWALTQNPKSIPIDGSTITVVIDGVARGERRTTTTSDRTLRRCSPVWPTATARVGFRILDTTALADGLHTVSWTVRDSGNNIEGIGSRYFLVANGAAAPPAAVAPRRVNPVPAHGRACQHRGDGAARPRTGARRDGAGIWTGPGVGTSVGGGGPCRDPG